MTRRDRTRKMVALQTPHDWSVRSFGDAAVAAMNSVMKGTDKGTDIPGSVRSNDFLVKREGRWQAMSTQGVTLKP